MVFFSRSASNRDLSSPGLGSICSNLFSILQVFKDPRTTHEEFIALKATTLINSVPTTITSTKSFRLLTNQVYQSIQYSCDSNPSVYHDNYVRHFTLLLQLPHIKMLSSKLIRLFLEMRANDLLPQADLLLEMLDAQDTLDRSQHFLTYNSENNSLTSRTASFSLSLAAAANANLAVSGTPPATVFSTKSESIYPPSTSFNQKQHDATIAATLDPSQGRWHEEQSYPSQLLLIFAEASPLVDSITRDLVLVRITRIDLGRWFRGVNERPCDEREEIKIYADVIRPSFQND